MGSVIHIAEIAAMLAVAYTLGWLLGYVARRATTRRAAVDMQAAAPATDAVVEAPVAALVTAPVIVPVSAAAAPVAVAAVEPAVLATPAPQVEPVPAPIVAEPAAPPETVSVTPPAEASVVPPAIAAEKDAVASPLSVDAFPALPIEPVKSSDPIVEPPSPPPQPLPVAAEPIALPATSAAARFRRFRPAPKPADPVPVEPDPAPFFATPATRPGIAWSGEIKGRKADAVAAKPAAIADAAAAAAPVAPPSAPADVAPPPPITPEPVPPVTPPRVYDEDAAMRAIEGGWSRVGARALSGAPELSDIGAAVAAAQGAVEQVLAKAGIDTDAARNGVRPQGLPRPRAGARDDLKRIEGLGALDESTLNNMGVYHFDQIAGWNEAQVLWMENHVFARGRIGREDWQRQARSLAALPL
jgi:predicted flap endonuclease-1-like 5' DNA nuclease